MLHQLFTWIYLVVLLLFAAELAKSVWVYFKRKKVATVMTDEHPFVSVIIPARNEEKNIEACLSGILNQTYPADCFEVITVDDHSEDRTRSIMDEFAKKHSNLVAFTSDPLTNGWGGKSHANHLASKRARGEFLIFMDADVVATPKLLSSVMSSVVNQRLNVVSIITQRILISWSEKILLPPLFIMFANAFEDRKVKLDGEFILFRRSLYDAIGGHAAIKSTVSDDLDFSLLLEEKGFEADFLFAENLASSRMYHGFNLLYEGISKMIQRLLSEKEGVAVWRSAKYFLFALVSVAATILYFMHFELHLLPNTVLLALPLLILIGFIAESFYLKISFLFAFLMPLSWLFQPVMLIRSLQGKRKKYHVWKGRKVFQTDESSS